MHASQCLCACVPTSVLKRACLPACVHACIPVYVHVSPCACVPACLLIRLPAFSSTCSGVRHVLAKTVSKLGHLLFPRRLLDTAPYTGAITCTGNFCIFEFTGVGRLLHVSLKGIARGSYTTPETAAPLLRHVRDDGFWQKWVSRNDLERNCLRARVSIHGMSACECVCVCVPSRG
jgi:hypothetical protein